MNHPTADAIRRLQESLDALRGARGADAADIKTYLYWIERSVGLLIVLLVVHIVHHW